MRLGIVIYAYCINKVNDVWIIMFQQCSKRFGQRFVFKLMEGFMSMLDARELQDPKNVRDGPAEVHERHLHKTCPMAEFV